MGTLGIMAAPTTHYLNSQNPSLQEGSKLSRWRLELEPKNQTTASPDEKPSSLGSQAHSSAGSDTDDSSHSGTNSQRQSPHFIAQQLNSPVVGREYCPTLGGWNVNAKAFQPVSSSVGHLFPSSQQCQPMVSDFSYPPPPITANSHHSAQQNLSTQLEPSGYMVGFQSTFVPPTEPNLQKESADPLGIGGTEIMGVWQDPNAGLKRWQTYTGTTVWGNPEEKANFPIQRWHDFNAEDCVDMLTRLDELAKKLPGTGQGWGALPTMDSLPAPLQRVQMQQHLAGIGQVQHRSYHNYQHQAQNYQRRVQTHQNRQPAIEHTAMAHLVPPPIDGPYQQQLQQNAITQRQMIGGGWGNPNNDGYAFGNHHQQHQRMGFPINCGNNFGPTVNTAVAPFHSTSRTGGANGWMCDSELTTNDGVDPNNTVSSLLMNQHQLQSSSKNSTYPSYFPFNGGDCLASVPGTVGVAPGSMNSIWCD